MSEAKSKSFNGIEGKLETEGVEIDDTMVSEVNDLEGCCKRELGDIGDDGKGFEDGDDVVDSDEFDDRENELGVRGLSQSPHETREP